MKYKTEVLPTISELAEYLGVSPSAVYQYNKDKKLLLLLGLKLKKQIDDNQKEEKVQKAPQL